MVKAIILCAGYATRLGELGERCAKPLLDIGGRPIIEYIMDKVNEIDATNNNLSFSQDEPQASYFVCIVSRQTLLHPRDNSYATYAI